MNTDVITGTHIFTKTNQKLTKTKILMHPKTKTLTHSYVTQTLTHVTGSNQYNSLQTEWYDTFPVVILTLLDYKLLVNFFPNMDKHINGYY